MNPKTPDLCEPHNVLQSLYEVLVRDHVKTCHIVVNTAKCRRISDLAVAAGLQPIPLIGDCASQWGLVPHYLQCLTNHPFMAVVASSWGFGICILMKAQKGEDEAVYEYLRDKVEAVRRADRDIVSASRFWTPRFDEPLEFPRSVSLMNQHRLEDLFRVVELYYLECYSGRGVSIWRSCQDEGMLRLVEQRESITNDE